MYKYLHVHALLDNSTLWSVKWVSYNRIKLRTYRVIICQIPNFEHHFVYCPARLYESVATCSVREPMCSKSRYSAKHGGFLYKALCFKFQNMYQYTNPHTNSRYVWFQYVVNNTWLLIIIIKYHDTGRHVQRNNAVPVVLTFASQLNTAGAQVSTIRDISAYVKPVLAQ